MKNVADTDNRDDWKRLSVITSIFVLLCLKPDKLLVIGIQW